MQICVPACRCREHVSEEVALVFASSVLRNLENCCDILISACNIAGGHLQSTKLTFQICMYWKLGFVIAWGDWEVLGPSMLPVLFSKLCSSASLTCSIRKLLANPVNIEGRGYRGVPGFGKLVSSRLDRRHLIPWHSTLVCRLSQARAYKIRRNREFWPGSCSALHYPSKVHKML